MNQSDITNQRVQSLQDLIKIKQKKLAMLEVLLQQLRLNDEKEDNEECEKKLESLETDLLNI